ncbi:LacI family DNA-binding transcriptional regulator [Alcaligenaceae bacterium]|nr:LacI family DNA-binding transcriptional regulator [Alcaligenaceae bacterium]
MIKSPTRNTIADVARHAGVSKATVSRFLNHRETMLSPEIAKRVEAAVTELGYKPSPMAQALKRGRSRLIGLVVADITNPYSVAVLRGAEQICREAGYLLMLFNLGNEGERESAGIQALSSYKVEGFILNTMGQDAGALLETARQGRPIVLVDRRHQGLDVDFVSLDNWQAVFLGAQHLLDAGYEELLLVSEPIGGVSSRIERVQAFKDFVAQHDAMVSGACVESQAHEQAVLVEALQTLRARAQARSTTPAIIANNAVVTLRVVAAVAQLGWRLGTDIGLVGIDDTEWAPYVGPGISTISQPTDKLGRMAAQCLVQRIAGSNVAPRKALLPGSLIVRGSSCIGVGGVLNVIRIK